MRKGARAAIAVLLVLSMMTATLPAAVAATFAGVEDAAMRLERDATKPLDRRCEIVCAIVIAAAFFVAGIVYDQLKEHCKLPGQHEVDCNPPDPVQGPPGGDGGDGGDGGNGGAGCGTGTHISVSGCCNGVGGGGGAGGDGGNGGSGSNGGDPGPGGNGGSAGGDGSGTGGCTGTADHVVNAVEADQVNTGSFVVAEVA